VIAILVKAPKRQSASFVFRQFLDGTGVDGAVGWGERASHAYVVVIGVGRTFPYSSSDIKKC
jgi:hypothetical protein